MSITARTVVAGVVGAPVRHSLSPLMHNAWLEKAGVDGVYVAFGPPQDGFRAFAEGLRGYVSLEAHMACGTGSCHGCVVDTARGKLRVCAEGPVFRLDEVAP